MLPDRAGLGESPWTLLGHPGVRAGLSCIILGGSGGSSPAGPVKGNNPAGGFICLLCTRSEIREGRAYIPAELASPGACPPGAGGWWWVGGGWGGGRGGGVLLPLGRQSALMVWDVTFPKCRVLIARV